MKCSKCGLDVADYQKEIEVEYKDFKTSEFLEIRQKKHSAPITEETGKAKGHPQKKNLKKKQEEMFHQSNKRSFRILAILFLLLGLITGAIIIIRYLTPQ
jgi:hypothetical protein